MSKYIQLEDNTLIPSTISLHHSLILLKCLCRYMHQISIPIKSAWESYKYLSVKQYTYTNYYVKQHVTDLLADLY